MSTLREFPASCRLPRLLAAFLLSCFGVSLAQAAPVITQLSPFSGQPGDVITVRGSGFSSAREENDVRFGPNQAAVRAASPTELTVQVGPGQPLGATTARVTVNAETSNGKTFQTIMRSKIEIPPNPPT